MHVATFANVLAVLCKRAETQTGVSQTLDTAAALIASACVVWSCTHLCSAAVACQHTVSAVPRVKYGVCSAQTASHDRPDSEVAVSLRVKSSVTAIQKCPRYVCPDRNFGSRVCGARASTRLSSASSSTVGVRWVSSASCELQVRRASDHFRSTKIPISIDV